MTSISIVHLELLCDLDESKMATYLKSCSGLCSYSIILSVFRTSLFMTDSENLRMENSLFVRDPCPIKGGHFTEFRTQYK